MKKLIVAVAALAVGTFVVVLAMRLGLLGPSQGPSTPSGGAASHDMVSTVPASLMDWRDRVHAVGQLQAVQGTDVASEMSGIVDQIGFNSGSDVAKGDLLLHLRLNDEPGHLQQLEAATDLAEISLQRDRRQLQAQTASQATIDTDEANLRADKAQILALRAQIAEKDIRAPFAGRIGIRAASLGQYLAPGTAIANLQQLDPLYVNLSVPQPQALKIAVGQTMVLHIDALGGQDLTAKITAIASALDVNTRMVQVQGTLANPQHILLPGMFASADIAVGSDRQVVAIPTAALTYSAYGSNVFVVGREGHPAQEVVHERMVSPSETRGDVAAIATGLREGDVVVTAGQLKLHDGDIVDLDNAAHADSQTDPHPPEE